MARITWTDEAQGWLRDIYDYIAADNPQAAAETVDGIYERAQALTDFPARGPVLGIIPPRAGVFVWPLSPCLSGP